MSRFAAKDEPITLVLTHPHRDHVHGFAELIEAVEPTTVALTGMAEGDALVRTLADEAEAMADARQQEDTGRKLLAAAVLQALRAINTWVEDNPNGLVALHDGVHLDDRADLDVYARAPDETLLTGWFERGEMADMIANRANALSAVLELNYGSLTVVLGGDLPVRDSRGKVPTGWDRVLASHGHLLHHRAFKVPHHGSRDALHHELIAPSPVGADRVWLVTPFNSSSLPRLDKEDGLERLLSGQSPIHLTAPSASVPLQRAHRDGRVTPAQLGEFTDQLRSSGSPFQPNDTVYRLDRDVAPLAAVWGVAFDQQGPVARWRGETALEVHQPRE
ncbi:MAG: hypothetical protein AAGN82_17820 [Myxococcota bacterium]